MKYATIRSGLAAIYTLQTNENDSRNNQAQGVSDTVPRDTSWKVHMSLWPDVLKPQGRKFE
eukprot:5854196-Pyramimonas_sp.AAC.1